MVDITQVEHLNSEGHKITRYEEFDKVVRELKIEISEKRATKLGELYDKVLSFEDQLGERVTDEEFTVLAILSLFLGTSKGFIEATVGEKQTEEQIDRLKEDSIYTQREFVTSILSNLDDNGKPIQSISRFCSLVGFVYEKYFHPENPLKDSGIERELGAIQGALGMVTTAFLFKESGFDVRFPPVEWDKDYNIDLLVKAPDGRIFGVDVTAKMPGDNPGQPRSSFEVRKISPSSNFSSEERQGTAGFISINVPPLTHHGSNQFYEDRKTGYPSTDAVFRFRKKISEITEQ